MEVELADDSHAAITEVTPQEEVEERENSEWLRGRLRRLPKAEREVWQLFYDEGLTVEEIAEARGISVASVRNTISSVRNTLRTALRRRFFDMRHLIVFILLALVSGIAVAAIIHPNGMVRGAIEHVLGIPKDTTVYRVVEVMPSYPGDMEALYKFLGQQMHYPKEALENGIEGRVVVRFVVEEDGRLTHFEAVSSPSPLLSNEAIRIMRQMPRWNPAKRMGRNVRCQYNIPVMFRLK